MDPADSETVKIALRAQGTRLHQHEEQLGAINLGVRDLTGRQENVQASVNTQVNHLAEQLHRVLAHLEAGSSPQPPAVAHTPIAPADHVPLHAPPPRLASPERFSGDSGDCRPFIVHCDLHYKYNPAAFPTDHSKVAFMVSHLTGRAAAWATSEWARDSPTCNSLDVFTDTLTKVFNRTAPGREAARALMQIKQSQHRVSDYAIEFRTLAADSGWNSSALLDAFLSGLSDSIKDQLIPLDLPEDLDSVIALAVRIDNRLAERQKERFKNVARLPRHQGDTPSHRPAWRPPADTPPERRVLPSVSEEPMQLGRAKLTPEERLRRIQEGRCFYCGEQGHLLASCTAKDRAHQGRGGPW